LDIKRLTKGQFNYKKSHKLKFYNSYRIYHHQSHRHRELNKNMKNKQNNLSKKEAKIRLKKRGRKSKKSLIWEHFLMPIRIWK
jgi:hypothetical protein